MPPPSAAAGAAVPLGGAVRVVEAVSGAALPRAEALWVLDQVLLGAGEEVLPLVCEVGEEEAHQREAAVAPLDLALRDQDHLAVVGDEDLR